MLLSRVILKLHFYPHNAEAVVQPTLRSINIAKKTKSKGFNTLAFCSQEKYVYSEHKTLLKLVFTDIKTFFQIKKEQILSNTY
jgi:5-formaminoimidazole-4-carboxamide-1-beta-D-ribofuranosyl 5'-monophosphate synthetase